MRKLVLLLFIIAVPIRAEDNPLPRVNPLISNQEALQARQDLWSDESASRFFMSTYEFEEDEVGRVHIRWAVKRAREGKQVDIVLDAMGHNLRPETLLYMKENGVNIHIFSPKFSWKGIKNRYKAARENRTIFGAAFDSVFKQATFRMHDKIQFNNGTSEAKRAYFHTQDNLGTVILGGRNARSSHFGLEKEGIGNINNPDFYNVTSEIEHEVIVHSPSLHKDVEDYIDRMLASELTEEFDDKMLKGKKTSEEILLRKGAQKIYDKGRAAFYGDLRNFDQVEKPKDIFRGLQKDMDGIIRMMEDNKLSPQVFNELLNPVLDEQARSVLKKTYHELLEGDISLEKYGKRLSAILKLHGANIADGYQTNVGNKKVLEELRDYIAEVARGHDFKGGGKQFFDYSFYKDIPEKLRQTESRLVGRILSPKQRDWFKRSNPVDRVQFIHDDIERSRVKKKIMNHAWDTLKEAKGDVWFNSQYGTPSENGIEAMKEFVRKSRPMTLILDKFKSEPDTFVDDFLKTVKANLGNIEKLYREASDQSLQPVRRAENRERLAKLNRRIERLIPPLQRGPFKRELVNILSSTKSPKRKSEALVKLLETNQESIRRYVKTAPFVAKNNFVRLTDFLPEFPQHIPKPEVPNRLHFMTNDMDAWTVAFDTHIQQDFHLAMEEIWRDFGKGVTVSGFQGPGRIHSKTLVSEDRALIWSANLDYRSEFINSEVGVLIEGKDHGKGVLEAYRSHLQGYMKTARTYIDDGEILRETTCPSLFKRHLLRHYIRRQL